MSNPLSGTVSIIDGRRLVKVGNVVTGGAPGSVAFSTASRSAYVLDETDGMISILAGDPPALVRRIAVGPGAKSLGFAPGGRLAFVANPARHEVAVVDAAADRVVRRLAADGEPDQIAFTAQMGYIRQAGTAMVRLVPLDNLAISDAPAPVIDVPAGRNSMDRSGRDCLAAAIARASGEDAVLFTNRADQTLYYYKEGLSAPMGSFRNYGHEPCAALAVDRSLRGGTRRVSNRSAVTAKWTIRRRAFPRQPAFDSLLRARNRARSSNASAAAGDHGTKPACRPSPWSSARSRILLFGSRSKLRDRPCPENLMSASSPHSPPDGSS